MPRTVSECDGLRQTLREMWDEHHWEVAWCNHYGIDYCTLWP